MPCSWRRAEPKDALPGLDAFVVGLLWVKVLTFLKVVNKQMATFILAVIQILLDLRYFAVVMIVVIFMFADMVSHEIVGSGARICGLELNLLFLWQMRIAVSTKDDGAFCLSLANEAGGQLQGPIRDFCSSNPGDSILRVYSIVIGDYSLDDYEITLGMTILFVILTLICVIVMLNVLIAVISDSYMKAKIESAVLFGRARVTFVAQNEALETFLRPGTNPFDGVTAIESPGAMFIFFGRVLRWLVLIILIVTAAYAFVFLADRMYVGFRNGIPVVSLIILFVFLIILAPALWILCLFVIPVAWVSERTAGCFPAIDRFTRRIVKFTASNVLGLGDPNKSFTNSESEGDEFEGDLMGRLKYMEKDIKSEILNAERRLADRLEQLAGTGADLSDPSHRSYYATLTAEKLERG